MNANHSQRNVLQHMQEPDWLSLSTWSPDHNIPTRYNMIITDELMGDNPCQNLIVAQL